MSGPPDAVSAVICVYNGHRWLAQAIESLLEQTLSGFELIVVDDGSTDDSARIVRSFTDPRIRLIQQTNQGLAAARNTGASAAVGSYLAYLDADDLAAPDRLWAQRDFLETHPHVAAVGCSIRIIDEEGRQIFLQRAPLGEEPCRRRLLEDKFYSYGSALMYRREVLLSLSLFRTFFRQREDEDLMLRLAERYPIDNLSDALYCYRINADGQSHGDLRVGLYYHRIAFDLHRERMATGSDRLQRGETVPPYAPVPALPPLRSDLRRVLRDLSLDEAQLLREQGRAWAAISHVARACLSRRDALRTLRRGLAILVDDQ